MKKSDPTPRGTARLRGPFAALIVLSAALQIGSFLGERVLEGAVRQNRALGSVASGQRLLIEQYQSATYLAVVGLATSDWEMLLAQRAAARRSAERFEAVHHALDQGGLAPLGEREVHLTQIDDPTIETALQRTWASWDALRAVEVQVLRSDHHSLRGNPDLDRFQVSATRVIEQIDDLSRRIRVHGDARAAMLERLQRAIPIVALLLTVVLGVFVFRRLIRPFEISLEDLSRSDRELRAARDDLELRVQDRTAALVRANEELRRQTELLDSMQHQMGDAVIVADEEARIILRNPVASSLLDLGEGEIDSARWAEEHPFFLPGSTTPLDPAEMPLSRALRGESTEQMELLMQSPDRPDGIWLSITGRPLHDADRSIRGAILVIRDVTARKQAEEALRRSKEELEERVRERTQELKEAQQHALTLARQAGMAELATNILHNVGNVLNSVNTSTAMLGEGLRGLRIEPVAKAAALLSERRADLAAFLSSDERGRRLPELLRKLGEHLGAQRDEMLSMTEALQRHVDHIRTIVEMQQSYATGAVMIEETSLASLFEEALRINDAALARHGVSVERDFEAMPPVLVDKHRVLQILLNLISNAKYALDKASPEMRRIVVRIERAAEDRVRLQVIDNGEGIEPALLTRIFQHGFTNRKGGHGFGLHSCGVAARALGGALSAHSEGPGRGATFTLELPFKPAAG